MLGFRLKEGLDLEVVASHYGHTAVRRVEEGVAEGLRRGWVIREQINSNGSDGSDGGGGGGERGGSGSGTNGTGGVGVGEDADGFDTRSGTEGVTETTKVESGGSPRGGLGRLRLSDPDGFLFSNSVISSVFCELDGWKRSRQEQKVGAATAVSEK